MQTARAVLCSSFAAFAMAAALCACDSGSRGADDIADEVGKALDPDPDYVDEPAREPQNPR